MSKKQSFVDHMRERQGKGNLPAGRPPFKWSAPIVEPKAPVKTDFEKSKAGPAPKPAAAGSFAPATHDLPKTRSMVEEARAAKKRSS